MVHPDAGSAKYSPNRDMDESLASWLRLREPADKVSRSKDLTHMVARIVAAPQHDAVEVLDLATGTGSNLRYLAGQLPDRQSWLVVDRDPLLLDRLPVQTARWGASQDYEVSRDGTRCVILGERLDCRVETRRVDLWTLDTPDIFTGRHLVTASALLDLVSEQWLRALAVRCRDGGTAALFALNYNGQSSCSPMEPEDDMIRNLLNRHQARDKGLGGPAAGPDAVRVGERCFAEVGYEVRTASSDWVLGAADSELQRRLIEGWAEAAIEMVPDDRSGIEDWHSRRLGHLDAGRSCVVVGHVDVAAWPSRATETTVSVGTSSV